MCDTAPLKQAVVELEAGPGDVAARAAAIDSLSKACPRLNLTLWHMLANDYGGGGPAPADQMLTAIMQDEGFHDVRRHACPNIDDYTKRMSTGELTRETLDIHKECNFARFRLYEDGEYYMERDYAGVLLYDWMTSGGVSAELARRFVRGIVQPGTGGDLPQSTVDAPRQDGSLVSVDQTSLKLDDKPLLTLENAHIPDQARDRHVLTALAAELETAAEQARAAADQEATEWSGRINLAFARNAAFGDVIDVMFTGQKAGYREYSLLTASAHSRAADGASLSVSPPWMWVVSPWMSDKPSRRLPFAASEPKVVLVDLNGFRFDSGEDGHGVESIGLSSDADGCLARESALFLGERDGCYDYAALEELAKAFKERQPHETVVTVRAAREIPLQIVVSAMDAVRGRECRLLSALADESVPKQCYLWQAIVDTNPPLPLHPERWDRLALRITSVEPGKGDLGAKRLRPRFEAALPALSKCIVDAERFSQAAVEDFFVAVRRDKKHSTRINAISSAGPEAAGPTNDCIGAAIGIPNDDEFGPPDRVEIATVGFAIELPD